jgi:hypothetical protein
LLDAAQPLAHCWNILKNVLHAFHTLFLQILAAFDVHNYDSDVLDAFSP